MLARVNVAILKYILQFGYTAVNALTLPRIAGGLLWRYFGCHRR